MKKIIKEYLPYVIVLILVILIKMYVVSPVIVDGNSMYSTLHDNDIMILNKLAYKFSDIKRFDIVVVDYDNSHLVKRIIGLPGEKIKVIDNKLYVNDEYVEESFLGDVFTDDFTLEDIANIDKIPDDYYFVMGDNRGDSLDSRKLGLFSIKDIEGKTSLTLFPFTRIGTKK